MRLAEFLLGLPRLYKRCILMIFDTAIITGAIVGAMILRLESLDVVMQKDMWVAAAVVTPFSVLLLTYLGMYNVVVRFLGVRMFAVTVLGVAGSALFFVLASYFLQLTIPRSVPIIFSFLAFMAISGIRLLAGFLLGRIGVHRKGVRIAIYGAGASGQQLASMLRLSGEYSPVLFMDDSSALWGRSVAGLQVYPPRVPETVEILREGGVEQILLAVPSAGKTQRKQIIEYLETLSFHVRTIPGVEQMLEGGMSLDQIQEVRLEDLLGRESVPANEGLLGKCIDGQVVLVTGAGGSIGSELCRQVLALGARHLLLLEQSEYNLYKIETELRRQHPGADITPLLGSVADKARVNKIFSSYKIDTVYHAAAYKHVPLVEHNPVEGVVNNTFGTLVVAQAAKYNHVKNFVLISTDKAVRPTNVMGATKRMAEIVLQALYAYSPETLFSMVRFGNVLGSSGSVVPRFREQIESGGPVTVTHPEINRYFMTIPEAVELVIQAGAMATGGDVFVLDMGSPVKIVDLAVRMIHLSGLEVRDEKNPEGDIEVVFSGLRPGEKLHEELLIGDNVSGTEHPKILRAEEEMISWSELQLWLQKMEKSIESNDLQRFRQLMTEGVSGYQPHDVIEDWLWKESGKNVAVIH